MAKKKKKKPPTILADPEEDLEILAASVKDVAFAAKKLFSSRLTRRAVILLIYDRCGGKVGKSTIGTVLDAAGALDMAYVKVKK